MAPRSGAGLRSEGGRYWARTSDPQLVESGEPSRSVPKRPVYAASAALNGTERPTGVPNPVTTVTTPQACDFEPCSGIRPTGSEGSVLRSTTVEALERQRPAEAGRS